MVHQGSLEFWDPHIESLWGKKDFQGVAILPGIWVILEEWCIWRGPGSMKSEVWMNHGRFLKIIYELAWPWYPTEGLAFKGKVMVVSLLDQVLLKVCFVSYKKCTNNDRTGDGLFFYLTFTPFSYLDLFLMERWSMIVYKNKFINQQEIDYYLS